MVTTTKKSQIDLVLAFCEKVHRGEFRAEDVRKYVRRRMKTAPSSPDRRLRDLRKLGVIDYTVVDRRKSLYDLTYIVS